MELLRLWQDALPVLKADDDGLVLTHFITTEHVDRYREVVLADGATIPPNGVRVLWQHGHDYSRSALPVGKSLALAPDTVNGVKGIVAQTQFYQPGTAGVIDRFPALLYDMHKQGILDGWSIGFTSELSERRKVTKAQTDGVPEDDEDDDDECLHHVKWTLLEYSSVAVPANPYAMSKAFGEAVKSGRLTQDELEHWTGRECRDCGRCETPDPQQTAVKPPSGMDIVISALKNMTRRVNG